MKSGIYKITNEVTGKFYIGSTKDIDWRWATHQRDLRSNQHCNPKLQHSWNFYGEDKFSFIILEETEPTAEKLLEREQYYLDTFKPYIRGIGYNIGTTAKGGDNITNNPSRDNFIEKMSGICSGEGNPMFGKNHTDNAIKKQKDKARGRFTLDWFISRYGKNEGPQKYNDRRLSLANRKMNYSFPSPMKGKSRGPMPDETKQKLKDMKTRMNELRPLIIRDIMLGGYIMKTIAIKYNVSMATVKYYKRKLKREGKL